MAEPKQKLSRSRSRKRRGQKSQNLVHLTVCPKCKTKIPQHQVCPVCGTYKNEQVLQIATTKTKVVDKKSKK